ncbi:MAG: cell division ATP-binding protein FtsE [Candidatus Woykebacteria bacterium RBG_16_43_9]|uniref:Cell division ATP-binding protein FtsE n=1 Tax=Candidatus Woykebacteria bacterium RBG_16_43_9 TaxID=1802596 RepID=A0A1G1WBT9_9BACT|nr:MAG: cell division ATP-binding protein FtsE [Candidatus Woykebacteria bacterium RBG_16_43_9]
MITFREVSKDYDSLSALTDISMEITPGEFVFLVGPSGAGKSTVLKLIIREDLPSKGDVFVDGAEVTKMRPSEVPHLRRRIGTVFQDFKLLPQRTVFENVSFPLEILGLDDDEIKKIVEDTIALVNLEHKLGHFPAQLSGGEAQRTAIARAMVMRPEIILADEPTGNLDLGSAWEVMQILNKLNSLGTTVVMATHNMDITSGLPHRKLEIQKGRIVNDTKQKGASRESVKKK